MRWTQQKANTHIASKKYDTEKLNPLVIGNEAHTHNLILSIKAVKE